MTPPVDIPSRPQNDSIPRFLQSGENARFVGSPTTIGSQSVNDFRRPPTTPISIDPQTPTPASFVRRHVETSPTSRISGIPTAQDPLSRNHEHQWSVFGQLMENDGFYSPSGLPSPRTRRSYRGTPNESFTEDMLNSVTGSSVRRTSINTDFFSSLPSRVSREPSPGRPQGDQESPGGYDSEDSISVEEIPPPAVAQKSWFSRQIYPHLTSPTFRNILKCSIAYFIAALFTFSPLLSQFISDLDTSGPSASGHMVATIAVYFNPAKTAGAMIEADLFCLFGVVYAWAVCLVSMSMFWFFEVRPGWEWLADVVAITWIAVSISILAWLKLWMENPSFNTACSMTVIIIFVVVVKEGGLDALIQVSGIIFFGSLISNLVCYIIWPQTATSNLRLSMTKTIDSFSTLLPKLTGIFLLEEDSKSHIVNLEKIQKAVEDHQNSFTSLQKNLREAKSEWALTGSLGDEGELDPATGFPLISGGRAYEDTVDCLNRLAQHLNGLRSGTRLLYDLTKAGLKHRAGTEHPSADHDEVHVDEGESMLKAAAEMFGDLVDELGPPMKALSSASTHTLNKLRDVCLKSQQKNNHPEDVTQPHEFSDLIDGIEAALVRFESTSNHAVLRLYRRSDANVLSRPTSSGSQMPINPELNPLTAEGDSENVFLVYFFIFTLQEFAKELILLVDAVERIYCFEQRLLRRDMWWRRSMAWIHRTCSNLRFSLQKRRAGRRRTLNLRKSILYIIPPHRKTHPAFPKIRPHAPDTIQTPRRDTLTFMGKVYQTIWSIGKRLKERDTKYGIRAGMATAILATPAFLDSTRPIFLQYWGDWALISFFVVISPTIGATNYLSFQRVLGTLFGAAIAVALYSLFPDDAIALSISGFLFSIPCFYFAVAKPKYISASRFVLLTYNLTCLYCYNLRQSDVSVVNIGFHRAVAVIAGVLWAAFVSRFWWPAEARRELMKSLSEFCLNIGWLYTRLVASNSFAPVYRETEDPNPGISNRNNARHSATSRLANSIQEFMAMELHLQIKLIELQTLLAQTQHEPRLKGPFPVALYRQILISLQTILDKLHSMRCVTTREECVRQDFILPVNRERREMVGNIMLSFSTLASSFRLKAPLPPYLPPVEKSRLRLVEAIRRLDVVKKRDAKISQQLLFFAYALTMKGVTMELEFLGQTLQGAFGVIGQTAEEFEMLFLPLAETQGNIEHVA
ncbi:hypothetical protein HYPSUDRAFT_1093990 [Hypholoma sublateritium FD-334 SS-4]|uniref:Uncharacterized protein n=1 Tax=Hypholoma sublateritium (strain FD-334 SS-4) TaxID=945553 RepID=A0A0D2M9D6_HYPSF|nr:hypothetical protein HYPSUDRAFT_1093990 [Hypholoma sublateritium FD-334 SS-4]